MSDRSIDRSGYGAFINENNPPSLAKGARRVLLVANSSGESMLSKGITTHSEAVIQPACIESMLVRHPRDFSLLQSTSRVSHTCARSRTRTHTRTCIYRAWVFSESFAPRIVGRESVSPDTRRLCNVQGCLKQSFRPPQTTTSHLRVAPHYASASLASTNKGRIRDNRHPRMTCRVEYFKT